MSAVIDFAAFRQRKAASAEQPQTDIERVMRVYVSGIQALRASENAERQAKEEEKRRTRVYYSPEIEKEIRMLVSLGWEHLQREDGRRIYDHDACREWAYAELQRRAKAAAAKAGPPAPPAAPKPRKSRAKATTTEKPKS